MYLGYMHQSKWYEYGRCTFMLMSPSCKQYVQQQEILIHITVMTLLGWCVSNVSIIFDCSMLLYILFWMFNGLIIHFHIIFGTNLLTGGPAQIAVFCLFQCFAEKEYQTESKRNETFGNVIFGTNVIQRNWSLRKVINEEARGVGGPTPPGAHSTLVGPMLLHRRTPSSYIYLRTPKRSNTEPKP